MFFYQEKTSAETQAALRELSTLLHLRPGEKEVTVTYGLFPRSDREIAMLTRSMLNVMVELATRIDVPARHVAEGRTVASLSKSDSADNNSRKLIDIKSSSDKPENAYVAVRYNDHWFWIDDRDFKSKRTFAFLMIISSTTETGGSEGLPLVTIPAG